MKYQYELTSDLCPVCCFRKMQPNQVYCSERCRTLAYNYRKRFAPILKHLSSLGFNCVYRNGVQMIITLPLSLQMHYPRSLVRLEFPDPCLDIDQIKPAHLWEAFRFHLGNVVGGMVEYLCSRGWFEAALCRDLLDSTVTATLNEYRVTFTCAKCDKRYILSVRSRDGLGGNDYCTDCAIEREPF